MKVLHVISSGGMYGAEAVILNLSYELNTSAQNLSCLAVFAHAGSAVPTLHEVAIESGVRSELLPCHGQVDPEVGRKLRSLVASLGVDVVHAHGYKADLYTYFAFRGRRNRPALVSTCHTWYDNDVAVRVYGALDRWVLRSFDQVVAVSDDVQRRLLGARVQKDRISIIQNGIVLDRFAQARSQRGSRVACEGPLRVGLVGRLAPEKGVDVFLRAVARIAPHLPEVQFAVAGDGPDRDALEALCTELGLQGRAELVGRQTDMPGFFASLDLLVSASRHEGLPVALLEGMASGLPLVATKVGSVSEIVDHGTTGWLVSPEDPTALADAMASLIANAAQRGSFAAAGVERVRNLFSAQRMAEDYLAVYRAALDTRASVAGLVQQGAA